MKKYLSTPERKKYVAAAIFLVVTFAIVGLLSKYTPILDATETRSYDFMLKVIRGPVEPPKDIVIVAIDDSSLQQLADSAGFRWPWPRSVHAKLIQLLNEAGARVIAFDVVFDQASTAEEDQALAKAIRQSRAPLVLGATIDVVKDPRFTQTTPVPPMDPLVQAGAKVGWVILNPDGDSILRHARVSVNGESSLSAEMFYQIGGQLDFSKVPIVSMEGNDPQILINFVGSSRTIRTISYYQALEYKTALPKDIFQGKMVIVGRSLTVQDIASGTQADMFATPVDAQMPGAEIHANVLNSFIRGTYISQSSPLETWILLIVPAILVSLIVLGSYSFRAKILTVLGLVIWWQVMAALLFVYWRHWVYTVQPLVVTLMVFGLNTLYQYWATEKERAHIRQALKGLVSVQVMNEILKNPNQLELGGVQVEATVLFSDIAGFSKISEKITPKELATMLNDYFTRMGNEIMKRDGMINKYIGDAIMAIWGAPLPNDKHALLACQSALAMKRIIDGMAPMRARVGINSGTMVAGYLGHAERMEYTVIGDAVNLASRLEGANKGYGTTILISESTEALVRDNMLMREVDCIRVVGKEQPVHVYEVVGELADPEVEKMRGLVESFNAIIRSYWKRDWDRSCALILRHLERFPNDPVAGTYLKRCQHFLQVPPAPDWDGVFALETK
ncbi:MAG TPA: adenylate/guanylate cyclase domain-containing protein [Acidobacteriota bacterium]